MEFYMKLPRTKKEFVLFMGIVSIISVNIIAPLITCFEAGFHLYVWLDVLKGLPLLWAGVLVVVLLTYIPAEKLTAAIVSKDDSFLASVTINILWHGIFDVHSADCGGNLDWNTFGYAGTHSGILL